MYGALIVSLFIFTARVCVYMVIPKNLIWIFLCTESLQGFTYALFISTVVMYANQIAPANKECFTQALILGMDKYLAASLGIYTHIF